MKTSSKSTSSSTSTTPSNSKSNEFYQRAIQLLPGGVSRNTIYRQPFTDYADFGAGCRVTDVDGKCRVDFANNMASLIHGHAHPQIVKAVTEQIQRGTAFTLATEAELRMAELLCSRVPHFEKIRFMNSGTEAVMAAIKAARAVTGRPKIGKVEGAYHGTYDYAEISQSSSPGDWGSVDRPASIPVADGTPESALKDVVVLPFNDIERSISVLESNAAELACVLIDPVPHRIGMIPATRQYVAALRDWTTRNSALFVLDEVITFRLGFAGSAETLGILPDLTAMGKIIGGGFPVGALAGSDKAMSVFDPGRVPTPLPYSGTFSANPITMTAGRVAMELFDSCAVERLNQLGDLARQGIAEAIESVGIPACVTGVGSMFRVHLKPDPPTDYRSAWQDERERELTNKLVDYLYENGFMMFRTCTAALSTAMTETEINALVAVMQDGLQQL